MASVQNDRPMTDRQQPHPQDIRKQTIHEILKHFNFSCPGGEITPICGMCGANPYCIELRNVSHSSATELGGYCIHYRVCRSSNSSPCKDTKCPEYFTGDWSRKHNASIAQAARDEVLDELIAFHAGCYYDKGKDEHQSWVDSIESLRSGGK